MFVRCFHNKASTLHPFTQPSRLPPTSSTSFTWDCKALPSQLRDTVSRKTMCGIRAPEIAPEKKSNKLFFKVPFKTSFHHILSRGNNILRKRECVSVIHFIFVSYFTRQKCHRKLQPATMQDFNKLETKLDRCIAHFSEHS